MTVHEETHLETEEANQTSRSVPRRLGDVGKIVDNRIGGPNGLQNRILRDDPQARGTLAALRTAASREPGEIPEIWSLTQVNVPDWAPDAPTREETAAHVALTLYALHQQSRVIPMHRAGVGLGRAAQLLVGPTEENPSARARFNALVTSTTTTELRHHLRTFVSLLRAKEIPLDYGMLADDIVQFSRPGGAAKVRLRWSRQYYSVRTDMPTPVAAGK